MGGEEHWVRFEWRGPAGRVPSRFIGSKCLVQYDIMTSSCGIRLLVLSRIVLKHDRILHR